MNKIIGVVIAGVITAAIFFTGGYCIKSSSTNSKQYEQYSVVPLPNGETARIANGNKFVYKETKTDKTHIDKKNNGTVEGGKASGTGEIQGSQSAPKLSIDDDSSTASGGKFSFTLKQMQAGYLVLLIGGIICFIIGGIIWAITKNWTYFAIAAGIGITLIAAGVLAETMPWIFLAPLAAVIGAAAYLIYKEYKAKQTTAAVTTAVNALNSPTPDGFQSVLQEVENDMSQLTILVKNGLKIKSTPAVTTTTTTTPTTTTTTTPTA